MLKLRSILLSSKAAIDLASIMVGIIVIGLIGGVIAATVFAVIPWAQNSAAKQQLESIHTAQNAAFGFSADPSRILPDGQERNSFTNSAGLDQQGLLTQGENYCTTAVGENKNDYRAYSKSTAGLIWFASNTSKQAKELPAGAPGLVDCADWVQENQPGTTPTNPTLPGTNPGEETPEQPGTTPGTVPNTDTVTSFTYRCDSTTNNVKPPIYEATGTLTWSDGKTQELNNQTPGGVTLQARETYTVTFDGTFNVLRSTLNATGGGAAAGARCLTSMDSWAADSGTTTAHQGLRYSSKLTAAPQQLPSTVTDLSHMFQSASIFNGNISQWDVSKITNFSSMFHTAKNFNQPIGNWNLNQASDITNMFWDAESFNQPVENWNVSNITDFSSVFTQAESFNQPLNNWNMSKATSIRGMLANTAFNHPLDKWDTSNVTTISNLFAGATSFNQNINNWDTSKVTDMTSVFHTATSFNQPLDNWDTSNVTNMNIMFYENATFNQDISSWDTSNVTNMSGTFRRAKSFNQDISNWNTSNVTNMSEMFEGNRGFTQNISNWNVSQVNSYRYFWDNSQLTADKVPSKFR